MASSRMKILLKGTILHRPKRILSWKRNWQKSKPMNSSCQMKLLSHGCLLNRTSDRQGMSMGSQGNLFLRRLKHQWLMTKPNWKKRSSWASRSSRRLAMLQLRKRNRRITKSPLNTPPMIRTQLMISQRQGLSIPIDQSSIQKRWLLKTRRKGHCVRHRLSR